MSTQSKFSKNVKTKFKIQHKKSNNADRAHDDDDDDNYVYSCVFNTRSKLIHYII